MTIEAALQRTVVALPARRRTPSRRISSGMAREMGSRQRQARMSWLRSRAYADRQFPDAADEVGVEATGRSQHLDLELALQDLLPQNSQLQVRDPVADAAVDAGAIGKVLTRLGTVDDEGIGIVDGALVAVARDIPHDDFVAPLDPLTLEINIAS